MHFDADTLMNAADMLGTVAFSISGAMTAIQRGLDLFGVFTLGIATALGGGIVRDIILGRCPPVAFVDWESLVMAALAAWAVFLFGWYTSRGERPVSFRDSQFLNVCDAIGLGVFSVIGVQATIDAGYVENPFFCIFLGLTTGVGGGVLRDVLSCTTPAILRKHFYAMASLVGALSYYCVRPAYPSGSIFFTTGLVVFLRVMAYRYRWELPKLPIKDIPEVQKPENGSEE